MINLKSPGEIAKMRESGKLLYACMQEIKRQVRAGVSTEDLDRVCVKFLQKHRAKASFLNYNGFPKSICASVNEVVVHGIPSERQILKDGDILSVDIGAILDGWQSDMARTFAVGSITPDEQRLIDVTKQSFFAGMEQAREGNRLRDISSAIEAVLLENNMGIVREFVGHGIGREMHEKPEIPNYTFKGPNPRLKAGMVLAIEPMVALGSGDVTWGAGSFMVATKDKSKTAHYENTVAVTADGPVILTAP